MNGRVAGYLDIACQTRDEFRDRIRWLTDNGFAFTARPDFLVATLRLGSDAQYDEESTDLVAFLKAWEQISGGEPAPNLVGSGAAKSIVESWREARRQGGP